jgi:hypothetical protein
VPTQEMAAGRLRIELSQCRAAATYALVVWQIRWRVSRGSERAVVMAGTAAAGSFPSVLELHGRREAVVGSREFWDWRAQGWRPV